MEKICGVLHVFNVISFILFTALQCSADKDSFDKVDDVVRSLKATVYGVVGLAYLVSAYFLYNTLKTYSYSKSKLMKSRLTLGV